MFSKIKLSTFLFYAITCVISLGVYLYFHAFDNEAPKTNDAVQSTSKTDSQISFPIVTSNEKTESALPNSAKKLSSDPVPENRRSPAITNGASPNVDTNAMPPVPTFKFK